MPNYQEFFMSPNHIKLLQNSVVRWEDCEFGAASIDCKRPYGNTSVYHDMCEILNLDYNSVDKDFLRKLHEETLTALQIVLSTGSMIAGTYVTSGYSGNWTLVAGYLYA